MLNNWGGINISVEHTIKKQICEGFILNIYFVVSQTINMICAFELSISFYIKTILFIRILDSRRLNFIIFFSPCAHSFEAVRAYFLVIVIAYK